MSDKEVVRELASSRDRLIAAARQRSRPVPRHRIIVTVGSSATANAISKRRWLLPGHLITVNRGWYEFARDASNTFYSRSIVVRPYNQSVLIPPALSRHQFAALLQQLVADYVRTSRWRSNAVDVNGLFDPSRRQRIRPFSTGHMYPPLMAEYIGHFTIAHELGHVLRGHCDRPQTTDEQYWNDEFDADIVGLEMMLDLLASADFSHLKSIGYVWGRNIIQAEDLMLVVALNAASLAFALMDLWYVAARRLHLQEWNSHPRGRQRYLALREHCIRTGIIAERVGFAAAQLDPEVLFSCDVTGLASPDTVHHLYTYTALDIDWARPSSDSRHAITDDRSELGVVASCVDDSRDAVGELAVEELDFARRALDDALERDLENVAIRRALSRVLIRLAVDAIDRQRFDDATTYLRAVQLHLGGLLALGFETRSLQSTATAIERLLISSLLRDNSQGPDAMPLVGLLESLRNLQRVAPETANTPAQTTPAEQMVDVMRNQLAGLMAMSGYFDEIEETLYLQDSNDKNQDD